MRSIKITLFLQELTTFLLAEVLAIYAAFRFLQVEEITIIKVAEPIPSAIKQEVWQFLVAILVMAVVIIIFLKLFKKSVFLFKLFFYLAIFVGCQSFFSIVFDMGELSYFLAFIIILTRIFIARVWLHNLMIILGMAGISVVVGLSIPWQAIILILLFMSIYDVIAVYGTKHMVWMFKELVERGVYFAFVFPQKVSDLKLSLKQVELPPLPKKGEPTPVKRRFMFLGTGDIALPSIFAVSVLPMGMKFSILVALGSLVGLFYIYLSLLRKPTPKPALPPIVLFSILFFLLGFLF